MEGIIEPKEVAISALDLEFRLLVCSGCSLNVLAIEVSIGARKSSQPTFQEAATHLRSDGIDDM
jgi:hypothetical protein